MYQKLLCHHHISKHHHRRNYDIEFDKMSHVVLLWIPVRMLLHLIGVSFSPHDHQTLESLRLLIFGPSTGFALSCFESIQSGRISKRIKEIREDDEDNDDVLAYCSFWFSQL